MTAVVDVLSPLGIAHIDMPDTQNSLARYPHGTETLRADRSRSRAAERHTVRRDFPAKPVTIC
jgi:hypothetical protein